MGVGQLGRLIAVAVCTAGAVAAASSWPARAQQALAPLASPILVEIGEHPTYSRITFDMPQTLSYRASRIGNTVTLTFDRPGTIAMQSGVGGTYGRITAVSQASARDQPLTVAIGVSAGSSIRHFVLGNRVVVDVTDTNVSVSDATAGVAPPETDEAAAPIARPPIPLPRPDAVPPAAEADASAAGTPAADASDPQSQVAEAVDGSGESVPLDEAVPAAPMVGEAVAAEPPPNVVVAQDVPLSELIAPAAAEPVTAEVPAPDGGDVAYVGSTDPIPQITVDPAEERYKNGRATFDLLLPTGLAAFERAGSLYLVFAARAPIDAEVLLRQGRTSFPGLQEIPAEGGVVLRLPLDEGTYPAVGRFTTAWTVTLSQRAPRKASIELEPQVVTDGDGAPEIMLPRDGTARVVRFADPIVGDRIVAVPVAQLGAAMAEPHGFVQLDLLESYQGIVIEPKTDTLSVRIADEGVRIDDQGGLVVSMP